MRFQTRGVSSATSARMTNVTSHCRALSRTSFTPNGTSLPAGAGGTTGGLAASDGVSISELEVDERPSSGRTQAQVEYHAYCAADTDETALEKLAKSRFIQQFVHPYDGHQPKHQRRDVRILPGGGEGPPHDQQGITQRFRAEEYPGERNEQEHPRLLDHLRDALAVNGRPLQFARNQHAQPMQDAPNHKRPGRAVPDAGDEERDKEIPIRLKAPVPVASQRNVHIVPEPTGETDVPTRPELAQAG